LHRLKTGAWALAAAATLVAGCGDGSLSHGDFVKKADAICAAYRNGTKGSSAPRTYVEIVAFVQKTLPLYEAALRRLEALKPPSGDADAVRAWLAADRAVARATRDLGDAGERRSYPGVTAAFGRAELASSRARRAASGLGMKVCGVLVSAR
jgi:hypothetical protein